MHSPGKPARPSAAVNVAGGGATGTSPSCAEATHGERADFGDAVEVAVDVDDAEAVVEGGLGDEQVGDGGAMPHAVMVGEVALQGQGPVEDVGGGGHDVE